MYKKKNIVILIMCLFVLFITIGYAAFSTALNINGTANIESEWKVEFTNITTGTPVGTATNRTAPSYTANSATMDVNLEVPGDSMTYEVTLTNKGTLDAVISEIKAEAAGSEAIIYTISGVKTGDIVEAGDSTNIIIKIEYDPTVTDQPHVTTKTLTVSVNVLQAVGDVITPSDPSVEEKEYLVSRILSDNTAYADNVASPYVTSETGIDFSQISSDTNGKGLYYTNKNTEGNRVTYYFRGDVENNYVSFAGLIWRIVRINEDGTVRLMKQDGSSMVGGGHYGKGKGDNAYVGWMHGLTGITADNNEERCLTYDKENDVAVDSIATYPDESSCTAAGGKWTVGAYEATHANVVSSKVKSYLDTWYKDIFVDYNFAKYIADAGFCNDRSLAHSSNYWDTGLAWGTNAVNYGWMIRNGDKQPQFACPQTNDLFTTPESYKGNHDLTYPIGLITYDELVYAGAIWTTDTAKANTNFYLYKSNLYFTMTPRYYYSGAVMLLQQSGRISASWANNYYNRYPVINLKGSVQISEGNGSEQQPYVIKVS